MPSFEADRIAYARQAELDDLSDSVTQAQILAGIAEQQAIDDLNRIAQ